MGHEWPQNFMESTTKYHHDFYVSEDPLKNKEQGDDKYASAMICEVLWLPVDAVTLCNNMLVRRRNK